ncbi:MAG TPA: metal ABC transporter substrate-binding protein [Planctomycetota bacterium]|nr:metal ABC transporter substrate-binding protein [Planctomycetota bacterium]
MRLEKATGLALCLAAGALVAAAPARADGAKLKVKTSLGAFATVAKAVGGDAIEVEALARPTEDPHEITATPELIMRLKDADVFVENGIGLESWTEKCIGDSKNEKIDKKAKKGYCLATEGVTILDVPPPGTVVTNEEHAFGNPHTWFDPLMGHTYAKNIEACLGRVVPDKVDAWERNREAFDKKLYEFVFGKELVEVMDGGERLEKLARTGKLDEFLSSKKFKNKPLSELLGGLMKKAQPLKGLKLIGYHDSVNYLAKFYGIDFIATLEPKSGVEPTPGHLEEVARLAKKVGCKVVARMTCEPKEKTEDFAKTIDAKVCLLPSDVGAEGTKDWFDFHEMIVDHLLDAMKK